MTNKKFKNYKRLPKDHWLREATDEELDLLGKYFQIATWDQRRRAGKQQHIVYVLSRGGTDVDSLKQNKEAFIEEIREKLNKSKSQEDQNSTESEILISSGSEAELTETEKSENEAEKELRSERKQKRKHFLAHTLGKLFRIESSVKTESEAETPQSSKNTKSIERPSTSGQQFRNKNFSSKDMEELKKLLAPLALIGTTNLTFTGVYPNNNIVRFLKQYEVEGKMHNATDEILAEGFQRVLRGEALENYLELNCDKTNWGEVKKSMKFIYQQPQTLIEKMIKQRQYIEDMNFITYVTDFWNLMEQSRDGVDNKSFLKLIRPTLPGEMQKFFAQRKIESKGDLMNEYESWLDYRANAPILEEELNYKKRLQLEGKKEVQVNKEKKENDSEVGKLSLVVSKLVEGQKNMNRRLENQSQRQKQAPPSPQYYRPPRSQQFPPPPRYENVLVCFRCRKPGHFARECRTPPPNWDNRNYRQNYQRNGYGNNRNYYGNRNSGYNNRNFGNYNRGYEGNSGYNGNQNKNYGNRNQNQNFQNRNQNPKREYRGGDNHKNQDSDSENEQKN